MIKKLLSSFYKYDEEEEISDRLFKIVLVIGCIMTIFSTIETLVLVRDFSVVPALLVQIVVMIICLILTLKFNRANIASVIMGILCICVVFPGMFIYSGGIGGGAPLWLAIGPIYSFLMFTKRKLKIFLTLSVAVDVAIYHIAYINQEFVHQLSTRADIFADSLFSVLFVGIGIGAILKVQIEMYSNERIINLKQKEELQNASKAQSAFFANMSHEIRTPINTIIGLNEMIRRSNPSDEISEYAGDIQIASKMLLNLINDVLDMTQLEMKKMELVATEYSSRELFGDLIDMIQVQIKAKKLILLVDIDRNLPTTLIGDEKRIKQIILNLLTNAVKYTPSGSVTLSVRSEIVNSETANLRISVADTGLGIKKEDLQHLYDSFKRLDSEKNKSVEGSGLGLSITKQLVSLMNGQLTVDSIYTKGSTFTVSIEQKIKNYAPIGNVDFFKNTGESYVYKQSFEAPEARILIVDDNRMNTRVESKLLEATKVQIDVANSGEECLELTKQKFYHVILMDYMMTGMNGAETLSQIRAQDNGLCRQSAVIILTANAMEDARFLCEEYGFDGFLEKPVSGAKLESEIVKFIPEELLENYTKETSGNPNEEITKLTSGKKKRVIITTDCVSDLPRKYVDEFGIKVMYLYIKTDTGRFADTIEIDCDNIGQFINDGVMNAHSDSVTVEEYEKFFADALTEADSVIHISMASKSGKTYGVAVAAAQGFDHVKIIDSGQISGGEGLVVLYAAKLAAAGVKPENIIEAVEQKKKLVFSRFFIPNVQTIRASGYVTKGVGNLISMLHLHPIAHVKNGKLTLRGVIGGKTQKALLKFISGCVMFKHSIDGGIVFVTHVNCNYRELKEVVDELKRLYPFSDIVVNKASLSTGCNGGIHSIGIAYYKKKSDINIDTTNTV